MVLTRGTKGLEEGFVSLGIGWEIEIGEGGRGLLGIAAFCLHELYG